MYIYFDIGSYLFSASHVAAARSNEVMCVFSTNCGLNGFWLYVCVCVIPATLARVSLSKAICGPDKGKGGLFSICKVNEAKKGRSAVRRPTKYCNTDKTWF